MILNSQIQINDMNNEFLSIMIIEFSNWLRFDQSQRLNLQLITNNLRNHFINERIVSSFDVNQWLQWVTNFIARKYTYSSQRFRSKRIIWHAHHLDWSRRVEIFLEKCRVELRSWTQALESNWEAWFDNSIRKLDSTRLDKILDRCK